MFELINRQEYTIWHYYNYINDQIDPPLYQSSAASNISVITFLLAYHIIFYETIFSEHSKYNALTRLTLNNIHPQMILLKPY